jgi:hypothetical protein
MTSSSGDFYTLFLVVISLTDCGVVRRELHPHVDYRSKQFTAVGSDKINDISSDSTGPMQSPEYINPHARSPMHRFDSNSAVHLQQKNDHRDTIPELKLRDLRRLDNHFNHHEEPYILIRRHCVLLSLGPHIRAIVQAERLLVLVFNDGEAADGGDDGSGVRILELLEEVISSELVLLYEVFECIVVFVLFSC